MGVEVGLNVSGLEIVGVCVGLSVSGLGMVGANVGKSVDVPVGGNGVVGVGGDPLSII